MIKYPYTDFHEMNLDWLLQQMKDLNKRMDNFVTEITAEIIPLVQEAIEEGLINTTYDSDTETVILIPGDGVTSSQLAKFFQISNSKYPIADGELRTDFASFSAVTPQMFGAVGDGITDDTAALQSAINNKGLIVFPSGTYLISEPVNISSNTHIKGVGNAVIKIKRNDNTFRELSFCFGVYGDDSTYGYDGVHDVIVEGITLDGNYNQDFTSTGHGGGNFGLSHCDNIIIRDCVFKNMVNDHYIDLAGSRNILIENCIFRDTATLGADSYEAINIDFSSQIGFPHFGAWDNTPCENINITNCKFYNLKETSFGIGCHYIPAGSSDHKNIIINNCVFKECCCALRMDTCTGLQFIHNYIFDGGYGLGEFGGDKFAVAVRRTNDLIIADNEFFNLQYGGVKIDNGGGSDTTYYNNVEILNNIFRVCNTQHNFGAAAGRFRYINNFSLKNNVYESFFGYAANISYNNIVSVVGNIAKDETQTTLNTPWAFDNISNGQALSNLTDRPNTNPYQIGSNVTNFIRQGNQDTTITAV